MKDNKYSLSAHAELAQIAFFAGTSTSLVISILNFIDNIAVAGGSSFGCYRRKTREKNLTFNEKVAKEIGEKKNLITNNRRVLK